MNPEDLKRMLEDALNNPGEVRVMRIKLNKDQIGDFLDGLQEIADNTLEHAVKASGCEEANQVIARIMAM